MGESERENTTERKMGTRERTEMNEKIKIENIKNWNEESELGTIICLMRLIMINNILWVIEKKILRGNITDIIADAIVISTNEGREIEYFCFVV